MTATAVPGTARRAADRSEAGPRVAYVVSRFPRLTETFVADEAAAVIRAGAEVTIHPLHEEQAEVVQPMAQALSSRVEHRSVASPAVLAGLLAGTAARPRGVGRSATLVVKENWGCRRLLVGAVAAFPFAVDLARRLQAEGVDHVHCHFATHPAVVGWVVHRLTGIPFSFTAHGSDLHRDRHMLPAKVSAARFVVAISDYNRQVIIDECGPGVRDRVHVVHCGIDGGQLPRRTAPPPRSGGPLHVCCIGTLHQVKGQAVLLEACRRLVARGLDVRCTLVGDGPDRASLEALAADAGLSDRVRITGHVTRPEVRAVLESADVLVAPSVPTADGRREGIPVVILEAMAVGVPVVASRLSGIPEAVKDGVTGLLVEPGDAGGVADALQRLAGDASLGEQLARRATALVASDFDIDRSAERLVNLFQGAPR